MKLPRSQFVAIDDYKLRHYILSLEHPVGRFKAEYFARLGFNSENWQDFAAQLKRIARDGEVETMDTTDFGQKYIVHGTIKGPAGRSAEVLTVWIIREGERNPRFVTVYPER